MGIRSVSSRVRLKELCSEAFFFAATEEKLRVVPVGSGFSRWVALSLKLTPGQVDTRIPKVERMVLPEWWAPKGIGDEPNLETITFSFQPLNLGSLSHTFQKISKHHHVR